MTSSDPRPRRNAEHASDAGYGNTFPKSVRLRKQRDFDAVYRGKHYAGDHVLVIRAIRNGDRATRLGLSVSRKVGNAVVRNRWKRIIREAFRKQKDAIAPGMDIVVRPKKGATCDYASVFQSLRKLSRRIDQRLGPRETRPAKQPSASKKSNPNGGDQSR